MVGGTLTAASRAQGAYQQFSLHGRSIAYRETPGSGPVLLLVHGVGASGECWSPITGLLLAANAHFITVDLPGHGQSSKGRGDYSLGAMASVLRDLLDHLGHDQAILVGHSLGGGIALQFLYQFPARMQGLVLVSSGGLGAETLPWLRAMAVPGSGVALAALSSRRTLRSAEWLGRRLRRFGGTPEFLTPEALGSLSEFSDRDTRAAFLSTLRSVVDHSGQRVSAVEKLALANHLPVLLIWGELDPTIPVSHGEAAAELLADGTLVVFPDAGHEPHTADPRRFAELVISYASHVPVAVT